ncbi:MAG: winged helix-turn-helix transcriptional regulator [Microthrixaceae bacterium]
MRETSNPTRGGPAAPGVLSPLDAALRQVGDRWTLLLVEALLDGPRRFGELLEALDGLAPNILSKRLKALGQGGLVTAVPYSQRPYRAAYALTASGAELAGALRLLAQWGAGRDATVGGALLHGTCGTPLDARWWCPTCSRPVEEGEAADLDYV